MALDLAEKKQQAHVLIDRLSPDQVPTAVDFLEFLLLDRISRKLATVPVDEEEETEAERSAVQEARDWLARRGGQGIPHEEILAEFGLTPENFKTRKG